MDGSLSQSAFEFGYRHTSAGEETGTEVEAVDIAMASDVRGLGQGPAEPKDAKDGKGKA